MDQPKERVELKCVIMDNGEQSLITILGFMMVKLFVDNWAISIVRTI